MNKKLLFALVTAGFLLGGCADRSTENLQTSARQQKGWGWNGWGWNGWGWNGWGWNGWGWNGWGWNGWGWNGWGWNGTNFTSISPDWDMSYFVNTTDVNGDGFITNDDRETALSAFGYFVGCACASGTNPTWTGWNPYLSVTETRTYHGNFGLGQAWCTGSTAVPDDQRQAVSSCLFALLNTKGIHNSISMRGFENSLKLVDNEKLFMSYASEQYWGNIWDNTPGTNFLDTTDGNYYPKTKGYACYYPWGGGNLQLATDLQNLLGRTCAWDGCGAPMKTSRACLQAGNVDGSFSSGYDIGMNPVSTADPAVGWLGANNGPSNQYQDIVTGTEKVSWRGQQMRRMSTFLGAWADLEVENWKPAAYRCSDGCGATDGCSCYKDYCSSGESGQGLLCERPSQCNNCQTIVRAPAAPSCGTSAACTTAADCVRGRKLTSLNVGCWLLVEFLRPYDLLTNTYVSGNANIHKAGTLAFRYSNGTGANTSIQIRDRIRNTFLNGTGFKPTPSWNDYDLHTVYPIYPGRTTFTGGTPGIEIEISGDGASPAFPHLDYAQLWVGPPYGVQPREMYWEDKKRPITPGATVCANINVDATTDLHNAGRVRFRPRLTGVDPNTVQIKLVHGGVSVTYSQDGADRPWSKVTEEFQDHQPTSDTWQVCVYSSGPKGTFDGADIEMEQVQ